MDSSKDFKPTLLRKAVLLTLLAATLVLLVLMEYACHVLPKVDRKGGPVDVDIDNLVDHRKIGIRNALNPHLAESYNVDESFIDRLDLSHDIRRRQIEVEPATTSTAPDEIEPSGTFAPPPSLFLQTALTSSNDVETPTPSAPSLDDRPQPTSIPGAPAPSLFLQTALTSSNDVETPTPSAPSPDDRPQPISSPGAPAPSLFLQTTPTSSNNIGTLTPSAPSPVDRPQLTSRPGAPPGYIWLQKKDTYVNSAGMYFLGAYLPVVLATFFALLWTLVGETTKSLEPFYQMAKPAGTPAEKSLAANFDALLAPLWALRRTQWTVVISTALTWLASVIVPLAPEAVFVYVGSCTGSCNGRIGVFLPAARAIEAALVAMVLCETILLLKLWRKKSGVSSDPRCIAGLATLFSDPDVQREFSEIYGSTDPARLNEAMKGHTYRLGCFPGADENSMTVAIIGTVSGSGHVLSTPSEKHQYTTVSTRALDQQPRMQHGHRILAIALAVLIAALLAVVVTYRFTGGETGFEHFMSGQGMGVKFLFTSIAVAIAWFWTRLFRGIALYAPYRRLFTGNATARESILISPPIHPLLGIYSFISSGHYLLAFIAVIGILSQVLCVTLSSIAFNPAILYSAYNVCTWISVAILVVMLLALTFVFFYREPIMPFKPDTVAGNLVYLCDGSLADMLKDLGGQDTKERNQRINRMGLRYEMGYAPGSGANRLVVLAMGGGGIA